MTASICAGLALRSPAMVGMATLTMKASTPNMNCAATTIARTHQRREESTGVETFRCMRRDPVQDIWHRIVSGFGASGDYLAGKHQGIFRPIADAGLTGRSGAWNRMAR